MAMREDEIIRLIDGTEIPIPEGTDPRAVEYLKLKYADMIEQPPGLLEQAGQALIGIPRGAASTIGLMGRGLAQLVPGEGAFERATERIIEGNQLDPRYAEQFLPNLGQGIGSIAAFALPSIATGGGAAGLAASAAAGSLSGAGEQGLRIDAARQRGLEVSPEDEFLATLGGLGVGATEAAPIGRIAGRLRRAAGIGARTAREGAETLTRDVTESMLGGAIRSGIAEGTQEVMAGLGQNALARYIYDPETELTPSMMEFTVGGAAGAIFDLVGSAAARRAGRMMGAQDYLAEERQRFARIAAEGPIRFDEVLADAEAAATDGREWSPAQYARNFDVREVGQGQFVVVDTDTGQALSPALTQEQADQQLATLDRESADKTLAAFTISRARARGVSSDPASLQALYEALHPDTRELPITSIASVLANEGSTDVFLQDPRSLTGVRNFRRGFNEAENAELDEVLDEATVARQQLDEAQLRTPTARAEPVRADAGALQREQVGSRVGNNAGRWTLDIDGREYRFHKWGSAGWAVYVPGRNKPMYFGRTLDGQESATDLARAHERDFRAEQAADTRAKQQKAIDRMVKRRQGTLRSAQGRVQEVVKSVENVASDPADQPKFDLLADFAAQGRLTTSPAEARRILGRQAFDDLLFNMAGMTVTTQADLMRELRATATQQGKPSARKKSETFEKLRAITEEYLAKVPDAEGALIKMDIGQEISDSDLQNALRSNGWKADKAAWTKYAEALLGRPIPNTKTLTKGERAYLLSRFATMATGSDPETIALPDPSPITYTNQMQAEVFRLLRERDSQGRTKKEKAIRREALISQALENLADEGVDANRNQIGQAIDDAVSAGRAQTTSGTTGVASGVRFVSDTAALERDLARPVSRKRAESLARRVNRRLGRDDDPTPGQVALAEESLAAISDMNAQRAQQVAEQAQGGQASVDRAGINKATEDAAADVVEAATVVEQAENDLTEKLARDLKLTDEQKRGLRVRIAEDGADLLRKVGVNIANPDSRAGVFVSRPGSPFEIILNLAAMDLNGDMPVDQIVRGVSPTLTYEATRFMVENDYLTQTEKNSAYNAANRFMRPDGRTYRDAAEQYVRTQQPDVDPTSPAFREYVTEQVLADMAHDFATGDLLNQIRASRAKTTLGKIVDFIRSMANFQKSADMRDTLDLLNRITSGSLDRRPGLGRINPQASAEVRSLRETTLGRPLPARRPGVAPPDEEGTGPPPEASPATESGTPEGAETGVPEAEEAEAVVEDPAMPEAERAALEDQRDESIRRDLASGIVPLHGPNTSAEAMKAYNESPVDRTREQALENRDDTEIRFRTLADPNGTDVFEGRYDLAVTYPEARLDRDFFTRLLDGMRTLGIYDTIRKEVDGRKLFNDTKSYIRREFLDGRKEIVELDMMMKRFARDNEGVELLANMEAEHAFRTADRLSQLTSEAIRGGTIRYVQGRQDRMGNWVRSTNPLDGHFIIDRTPMRTSSGKQYASLIDILRDIYTKGKKGELRFHDYLVKKRILQIVDDAAQADRAIKRGEFTSQEELRDLERRRNLGKRENLPNKTDPEKAREMVDAVETRADTRWMVEAAEGLTAWNDSVLTALLDSGVLSRQKYDAWVGQVYVGFTKAHQDFVKEGTLAARKLTTEQKAERAMRRQQVEAELTGSDKLIDTDLFQSIYENFTGMMHDAVVNTGYARVVNALATMSADPTMPVKEGTPLGRFVTRDELAGEPWVIRYMENGEERLFKIDINAYPEAPHLIAAMQFTGEDFYKGAVRALPAVANLLRQGVTRMPEFILRNLFKDTVAIYGTSGSDFTPIKDTFTNFWRVATGKDNTSFEMAKAMGLALETDNLNDRNRHATVLRRIVEQADHDVKHDWSTADYLVKTWNYLGDLSRISDTSTRMAIYDSVLEQTGNHAEATKQALEAINYGRRGRNPVWRLITASIPFLNARVQGLDVVYRTATGQYTAKQLDENGKRRAAADIQRTFITRGLYLVALTGAYYMAVRDEEWYKNLRDEVKDDYWLLPIGDFGGGPQAAKIPVPFEIGLLFKTLPEQIIRVMDEEGYTGEDFARAFVRQATQTTMFSPMPQLVAPAFDAWRNYNSFTRSPITPTFMDEGLPYLDRTTESTTEIAKMFSALMSSVPGIEVDPMRVEYLFTGYMGTIGNYLLRLADVVASQEPARQIFNAIPLVDDLRQQVRDDRVGTRADYTQPGNLPFFGPLIQDLDRGGGYQQDFFELRQQINQAVAGINRAREEGRDQDVRSLRHELAGALQARGQVRALDRYMQTWRGRRDRLLRSQMPEPLKREALRNLEQERDLQLAIVPFLREVTAGGNR